MQKLGVLRVDKIGILTYHYSNNYGGVLQSYALYRYLESQVVDVEIIDYVPSSYKPDNLIHNILTTLGLRKNPLNVDPSDFIPRSMARRIRAKKVYNHVIGYAFDSFRNLCFKSSVRVDENDINAILSEYCSIIVGSDQIWGPVQRGRTIYFLDFDEFNGNKISYAADSTIAEISEEHLDKLRKELRDFDRISVRNKHSQKFVETVIGEKPPIVADLSHAHFDGH
jgi:hypothetical protein